MIDPRESPTLRRVMEALEGVDATPYAPRDHMPAVRATPASVRDVLERLRARAGFETMTLVTGVDHHPNRPRFEVVHQLHSLRHGDRLRVTTPLADEPRVATCVDLYPGAAFMERECYDMFGFVFEGHDRLRRLMMPEAYEHFPLRKDFPHQGIEPDRLYREWDRRRHESWSPE